MTDVGTETVVTAEARYLQALAHELAAAYAAETVPAAVLLTGSAATGVADRFSDLDLIAYYETLPTEEAIAAARRRVRGSEPGLLAPPTEDAYGETFVCDGVHCQVVHETIAAWEQELRSVLVDHDVDSPLQKAVAGLHEGIALHGAGLIERWRAAATYPDGLARAMVERHWRFFPLWHVQDRLLTRDATLWRQEALVDAAFNLLGTLAALNRVWFTRFQLKHTAALAGSLALAPSSLAERIESLFTQPPRAAIGTLEALVAETQAVLAEHMPDFDSTLARGPGTRDAAWTPRA